MAHYDRCPFPSGPVVELVRAPARLRTRLSNTARSKSSPFAGRISSIFCAFAARPLSAARWCRPDSYTLRETLWRCADRARETAVVSGRPLVTKPMLPRVGWYGTPSRRWRPARRLCVHLFACAADPEIVARRIPEASVGIWIIFLRPACGLSERLTLPGQCALGGNRFCPNSIETWSSLKILVIPCSLRAARPLCGLPPRLPMSSPTQASTLPRYRLGDFPAADL